MYARGIRDGSIVDHGFLPVLYEFPPAMLKSGAARELKNFYVTNPNLGASVDEAFLERKFKEAQEGGDEAVQGFLAKHANVEVGLSLSSYRWAGADFWQKQTRAGLCLAEILARSDVLCVGIDGGGLDDLLGLAVLGRDAITREWLLWSHAWAHPSVLERRKSEAPRFKDFAAASVSGALRRVSCPLMLFAGGALPSRSISFAPSTDSTAQTT